MINRKTLHQIQDERSGLWFNFENRSWGEWKHATLWAHTDNMLSALTYIDIWNRWCDKKEHKRVPLLRSFDVVLKMPAAWTPS